MVVVIPNQGVFIQMQMPLPSGVLLSPVYGVDGRLASNYDFSLEDIKYMISFSDVYVREGLPSDWQFPDNGI